MSPTRFKYDATKPTFGLCPTAGPFTLGSGLQPVGPITPSDNLSLIDSAASTLSGTVDTSTIGTKTVVFTAVDNASNSETKSCTYSVIFNFTGFFQPVDNIPTWNKANAGQSIPMKFSLGGNQGLNVIAAGYPKIIQWQCPSSSVTVDPIETYTTTANNGLVYDPVANQYNYVWKTDKSWANKCVKFQMVLTDGTTHEAMFQFVK
jgi:hypothetical protein